MKKIEILKLIEANRIINKNKKFEKIIIDKKYRFPDIEELKQEFEILNGEIEIAINETTNAKNYIRNSNCSHDVRLKYYGEFCCHHSECIFCGESVKSDNWVNFEYSNNRNKYCVDLDAKYQKNEDCDYIPGGYTNEQVYKIIMKILKDKKDDDEIDLIQEFKKLNLKNCEINEEKKVDENFILIIGGTNKQFIDNESYLYKKGLNIGLDFIKYFSSLLNTKIELIDNKEVFENQDKKIYFPERTYNLKFVDYNSIEELKKILYWQKDIPFKIVIDLSELYDYKIINNQIEKEEVNINLKEYFPNSYIIRIPNLSTKSLEELSDFLKNTDNLYAYQNNKYYYIENEEIKYNDLDDTCFKIKKLLRKEVK